MSCKYLCIVPYHLNISSLSTQEENSLVKLRGPTLIEILYTMPEITGLQS